MFVEDSSILVKREGQKGIVRVVGKGSFKNAQNLKKYIERASLEGVQDFVLDLQDCVHMDSTFMGVMAGMGAERRRMKLSTPEVVNTNSRNLELLETLGLDRILTLVASSDSSSLTDFNAVVAQEAQTKVEVAETMLEAHQNLIDLDAHNAAKFQDVMVYLKDKLGAHTAAS